MSESAKISAMSQEVVRRMCNTCEIVDQEVRDDIVDAFSAKLYQVRVQQAASEDSN